MRIEKRYMEIVIALCLLVAVSACKQYKTEVVLKEDGSGTRTLELSSRTLSEGDIEIALDDFRRLFSLEEKSGWLMKREVTQTKDGEKLDMYIFTLDREAADITSWRAMSGDLSVKGTLEKGPCEDIALRNEINVAVTEGKIYTYRETLVWNMLKEKIVDFQSNFFKESIATEYPFLSKGELEALKSFFAGVLVVAWYAEENAEGNISDEIYTSAVSDYAEWVIRSGHRGKEIGGIREFVERALDKEGEEALNEFIMEKLPGVYLAGHTSMTFRITMPGEITETNAHKVEGRTAIWEYDLMLAPFNHAVKLFAKSELQD
jgi:hypothetical protein